MRRIFLVVGLLVLMMPSVLMAAGTCYQWSGGKTGSGFPSSYPWVDSPQEAMANALSACNSSNLTKQSCMASSSCNNGAYTCGSVTGTLVMGTFPAYTINGQVIQTLSGNDTTINGTNIITLTSRANPEGCPNCPEQGAESTLDGASGDAPSSACVNGCQYGRAGPYINFQGSLSGLSGYIGSYKSSGVSCSQTAAGGSQPQATENDCKATSTDVYCMVKNQSGENCGQVNGEWFCAKSTKPGVCTATESGGAVCGSNRTDGLTETPPGPDTGAAGTPATPTASVKDDATGRTTNYYNNSTVTNSTTASGSSSSGSSGSSSSGASSSSSSSSCSSGTECGASGGDDCANEPVCNGDSIQCTILRQSWLMRCSTVSESDAVSAFASVSDGVRTETVTAPNDLDTGLLGTVSGDCPADPSFTVMGTDFTIPIGQFLCPMLFQLSAIIVAVAYFLAGSMLVEAI